MTAEDPNHEEIAILRGIADASTSMVVDLQTAEIVRTSPFLDTLFGYLPGELNGQSVHLLLPPEIRELHAAHYASYAQDPHPRQMGERDMVLEGYTKAGHKMPLEVFLWPKYIAGRPLVFVTIIPRRTQ